MPTFPSRADHPHDGQLGDRPDRSRGLSGSATLSAADTMPFVMREFRQVDVFTTTAYLGNPLAVVLGADGLSDDQMRRFANWTNLSETTFVLAPRDPQADYRVRIFTPSLELPFAGHPTLGTCHAWLESGGMPRTAGVVMQECGAGLVRVRQDADGLAFAAPPLLRSGPVEEELAIHIAEVLGIDLDEIVDLQWADNGPGWVAVLLASAEAVLAVRPGMVDLDLGIAGPYPPGSPAAFEVRAFAPSVGAAVEDPVTGSFNASLAEWLLATGRATAPYLARQGTVLGRRGEVHITQDDEGMVWVGGGVVTCVSGTVSL
jgi:PhzF family phenazine biosynthesis protein